MTLNIDIDPEWYEALHNEFRKPYFFHLWETIKKEREIKKIYPPEKEVFNAIKQTPLSKVKVVILGQDPYHGPGQAHGLSFSVPEGVPFPPSLRNIFKELSDDLHIPIPASGNLIKWAKQGVLLLNTTLTVPEKQPMAHAGLGWETFTNAIIEGLVKRKDPVIFVLWGSHAKTKVAHIMKNGDTHHFILSAPHPSPLSAHRGFLGCKHFSAINRLLVDMGKTPIQWEL